MFVLIRNNFLQLINEQKKRKFYLYLWQNSHNFESIKIYLRKHKNSHHAKTYALSMRSEKGRRNLNFCIISIIIYHYIIKICRYYKNLHNLMYGSLLGKKSKICMILKVLKI